MNRTLPIRTAFGALLAYSLLSPGGLSALAHDSCAEAILRASDGANYDTFGVSVAISGEVAIIGAYEDDDNGDDSGSAYIYRIDGAVWTEEAKLLASDGASDDFFGFSVAISGDVAVVGAYANDDNGDYAGSAYIYRFDGTEWAEEAKLLPSDGASNHYFGVSVALSGNVAIVGAPGFENNGNGSGATYVYRFDGTEWIEEGKLLASDGASGDLFGFPVALSGDVAVIGASYSDDNGEDSGSAYVFRFDGSIWTEEAKLLPADGASEDSFGYPLAVSGDVAVVGASYDDDNGEDSGSAYVFRFDGTEWAEESKLLASDGGDGEFFGYSVAVSGNVAVIGAIYGHDELFAPGSAYIYQFEGTEWTEVGKLLAADGGNGDRFGASVAISGASVIVGADSDNDNGFDSGSAYVFDCDCNDNGTIDLVDILEGTSQDCTNNYVPDECEPDCNGNTVADTCDLAAGTSQDTNGNAIPDECELGNGSCNEFKLLASDGAADDLFGTSIALSDDVLVVGAVNNDNADGIEVGAAYVYRLVGLDWIEEVKLLAADGATGDDFGSSVAISGELIVIGADDDSNENGTEAGAAYVYRLVGADWIEEAKLLASDGESEDAFGHAVAVHGDVVIVGAYLNDDIAYASGSAYIYRFDGVEWTEEAKMQPPVATMYEFFGRSVAVSDDVALIGARGDNQNGVGSGAVYVYRFDGHEWIDEDKLAPADNTEGDAFGGKIAMHGNLAVIGAAGDDDNGTKAGSAYIYSREGTDWVEQTKLVASDGASYDVFGASVAIMGNLAIVGASLEDENGTFAGSAYLYRFDGTHWTESGKFLASDGGSADSFGGSVAISGAAAVFGALGDDDNGSAAGSAYIFVCDCNGNGVFDTEDILGGTSQDCSGNQIPDECEPDCNGNGIADSCDTVNGTSLDCNLNEIPDECIELENDCNANGLPDECDLAEGTSPDCNANAIPDECDLFDGTSQDCNQDDVPDACEPDCNDNGVADECDIDEGTSNDCDGDVVPDECGTDCNSNGFADSCDIAAGTSHDCNDTGIPDECDIAGGTSDDCNGNGVPDLCDLTEGTSSDCNSNGVPDECLEQFSASSEPLSPIDYESPQTYTVFAPPLAGGHVLMVFEAVADLSLSEEYITVDINGTPVGTLFEDGANDCPANPDLDVLVLTQESYNAAVAGTDAVISLTATSLVDSFVCGPSTYISVTIEYEVAQDCNGNSVPDECDVTGGTSLDCSRNGIPDECEADCNNNGVMDGCDLTEGTSLDCNENAHPDECDIGGGASDDCDLDGVPDECSPDCNGNAVADICDIAEGTSQDCNENAIPDDCDIAEGTSADVNINSIPDECEELCATNEDCDDGVDCTIDLCDLAFLLCDHIDVLCPCEGDANGDGLVDPLDAGFVLARFGCPVGTGDPNCDIADMNGDGLVDPLDSGFVLARFGACE